MLCRAKDRGLSMKKNVVTLNTILCCSHWSPYAEHRAVLQPSFVKISPCWTQNFVLQPPITVKSTWCDDIIIVLFIISRLILWCKSVSQSRRFWVATTALWMGLRKAPQITSNGERDGKWWRTGSGEMYATRLGRRPRSYYGGCISKGGNKGYDIVKGELW